MRALILLFAILLTALAAAPPARRAKAPITKTEDAGSTMSEIGLSTGQVLKGFVIRLTPKEIVYKENTSAEEKTLSAESVIFVRAADGTYRFIFPPEPAGEVQPAPVKADATRTEFSFSLGTTMHIADNSATGAFTSEYATALAIKNNQLSSLKGFTALPTRDAAGIQWQFNIEPRLVQHQFMVGLSVGYAALPKTAAVVSSAAYPGQLTINLNGMLLPAAVIVYYRLIAESDWGLSLGFGAGVLYSAVRLAVNNGTSTEDQVFTSYNPMLVFKPEITYKLGRLTAHFSVPVYWAESRDVSDGDTTLAATNGKSIISANLTGIGVSLAIGMNLF